MKHRLIPMSVFATLFVLLLVPSALAASLTSGAAEGFVNSLTDVNNLAQQMEEEGKDRIFEGQAEPVPGKKFAPYSESLPLLKSEYPAEYKELGKIVRKHGFKSQESWATAGDNVMLAYMAGKMNIPAASAMPQLPPGMADKLPPETRAQMAKSLAVMETIRDVPQEHKDIVAPLTPKIDMWIASQSE